MTALLGMGLLVVLMLLGVPVAWSFAAVLAWFVWAYDVNTTTLLLQGFRSLDSVILLALPLFVLAGYLMQSGGVAARLIAFIEHMVRNRKGGLGASMVLSSSVFGAISGTATAAIASVGTLMITPLAERGYPRGYSSALLGLSSLIGILIPPSITLILFGVVTRQSITALFAATVIPGLLLMLGLIVYNRVIFRHQRPAALLAAAGTASHGGGGRKTLIALPALCLPVLILGGIYGGVFTPTEAAGVAVFAALFIGFFIYRDLTPRRFVRSVVAAGETTGTIILILLFSFMISRVLAFEGIPQDLTRAVSAISEHAVVILLLVNLFLIVAGMVMDDLSVTVVIAPLFLPLMLLHGIDPIHFGAIVACSVVIGANSPPVAPCLYMACRIGRAPIHDAVGPALTMLFTVATPVLLLVTFIPGLSLWLPRLLGVH
jgi:C4-dicarboxylate transporter, DctM subunit